MLSPTQIKIVRRSERQVSANLPVVFEALGEWGRFRIFRLLATYHDLCVSDVAKVLGISVPAASQQLKVLERTGLVRRQRNGQMICYELRSGDPLVRSITKFLQVNEAL